MFQKQNSATIPQATASKSKIKITYGNNLIQPSWQQRCRTFFWVPASSKILVAASTCVLILAVGMAYIAVKNNSGNAGGKGMADNQLLPMVLGATDTIRGNLPDEQPVTTEPKKVSEPNLIKVSARAFLVLDLATGEILAEQNSKEKISIGSLTKLMTALVVYEQLNINDFATVTPEDILKISPSLGLKVGQRVQITDLFNAMLIGSVNDAAFMLAHIMERANGEKSFTELMNLKAEELGMENSRFSNPMGFDSYNNYSTLEDIKKLVLKTRQLAAFTGLGRKTEYIFYDDSGKIRYRAPATNKLIQKRDDIEAIKTGYTANTGGAMVSQMNLNENSIIIMVADSSARETDTVILGEEIFKAYRWGGEGGGGGKDNNNDKNNYNNKETDN